MILLATGATMLATSVIGMALNTPTADLRRTMRKVFESEKIVGITIRTAVRTHYGFDTEIVLPYGFTVREFKEKLTEPLEQATYSTIKVDRKAGPVCSVKFGQISIEGIKAYRFDPSDEPMKIPMFTPFGVKHLDLKDESSCHIMGGGATRMGKTSLINVMIIHSLLSTKGHIKIVLCTMKPADAHIFRNIPQINLALTKEDVVKELEDAKDEMDRRLEMLLKYGDSKDISSLRRKHPEAGTIPPVLFIFDEYGAFSDKKDEDCKLIHQLSVELAERAGYLDMHLFAFSQRTDVTDVFPPRMKNNMLTKIAFTTGDENNSKLIIGVPDAAHLGAIKGRAIIVDGMPETVQVPYVSEESAAELLRDYYVKDDQPNDEQRQENDPTSETFSGFKPRPVGEIDLPGGSPPLRDDKPNRKKTNKRGVDSSGSAAKG